MSIFSEGFNSSLPELATARAFETYMRLQSRYEINTDMSQIEILNCSFVGAYVSYLGGAVFIDNLNKKLNVYVVNSIGRELASGMQGGFMAFQDYSPSTLQQNLNRSFVPANFSQAFPNMQLQVTVTFSNVNF
jgi:hypothetical protein